MGVIIVVVVVCFFFFKQKTAYEIGTGDWSSDVCSSDLAKALEGFDALGLDDETTDLFLYQNAARVFDLAT